MALIHFQSPARKKGAQKSARKINFAGDRVKSISTNEPASEAVLSAEAISTWVVGVKRFARQIEDEVERFEALSSDGACKALTSEDLAVLRAIAASLPHLFSPLYGKLDSLFEASLRRRGL